MKKRIYGFDAYKNFIKEGVYKPGFITEYEETSIDDVTPSEEEAPAAEEAPAEQTSEVEEAPAEETTEEAPAEEAPVEEAPAEEGVIDQDFLNKVGLVAGMYDEIEKYAKGGGAPDQAMIDKVEAGFLAATGSATVTEEAPAEEATEEAPAEEAPAAEQAVEETPAA